MNGVTIVDIADIVTGLSGATKNSYWKSGIYAGVKLGASMSQGVVTTISTPVFTP